VRGLIDELNTHLLDRAGKGKNCVLIIDEAQNLGTETLEQIRLLSNLETETEKLLQIVLIGQPELADKLALTELRQLNQRITARYHLRSLSSDETLHYIAFRLRVAGGQKKVRFTRRAVRCVHRLSRGTPRVINAICDRALLIGYTKEARTITPRVVRRAAQEIQGTGGRRPSGKLVPASGIAVAVLAVLAALFVRGDIPSPLEFAATPSAPVSTSTAQAPTDTAEARAGVEATSSPEHTEAPAEREGADAPRGVAEAAILPAKNVLPDSTDNSEKLASVPGGAEPGGMEIVETSPSVHRGIEELVRAWNSAVLQVAPTKVTADTVERFARANDLRLLVLEPTVEQLIALGLPALVRLDDDESWAALIRVEDGEAHLINRTGEKITLALADLRERYGGEAYYLWKDPKPAVGLLRASSRGQHVEELQGELQQLGLLDRDPTGEYDATTIDTVTKIQRATGIDADGITGPQTRMVLASWLGTPGTPRLSSAGFTDGLRSRVLASRGIVSRNREAAAPVETAPPEPVPPDVIEPAFDIEIPSDSPDPENAKPAPAESYTPVLPGNDADVSPPVTPSTVPGTPIRPSDDRETLH
jgi:general secretion pathway protein A